MEIVIKHEVGDCVEFINKLGTALTGTVKEIMVNIREDSAEITYKVDVLGRMWDVVSVFISDKVDKNEHYRKLNERFDKRVEVLKSLGYHYYKEYVVFAKSEMSAMNHNGIPNGVIMHCEDYHFNNLIGK